MIIGYLDGQIKALLLSGYWSCLATGQPTLVLVHNKVYSSVMVGLSGLSFKMRRVHYQKRIQLHNEITQTNLCDHNIKVGI